MGYQAAPNGSIGPPCGLYQIWSHTEGTALLLESNWLPLVSQPPPPPPPPFRPPIPYRLYGAGY